MFISKITDRNLIMHGNQRWTLIWKINDRNLIIHGNPELTIILKINDRIDIIHGNPGLIFTSGDLRPQSNYTWKSRIDIYFKHNSLKYLIALYAQVYCHGQRFASTRSYLSAQRVALR